MRRFGLVILLCVVGAVGTPERLASSARESSIARYLRPGFPSELVSAKKADRLAWIAYEEGRRNVYTAAAPLFKPVRVTSFLKDDGTELTGLSISDDGTVVAFVRGLPPNSDGWVANATSNPDGAERAIWAARIGGAAFRLAEGTSPELSPDGRFVIYLNDGQIYRARVSAAPAVTKIDKGEAPFIAAWGRSSTPQWSPDGSKIAFTSNRTTHSFIGIYDTKARTVSFIAPGVDRDSGPTWSPDGRQIAFLRRPGLPFGQQEVPGRGTGLPAAGGRGGGRGAAAPAAGRQGAAAPGAPPAAAPATAEPPATGRGAALAASTPAPTQAAAAGRQGGRGQGRGGEGGANAAGNAAAPLANQPGLYRAALPNGATLALMVADLATGDVREAWHPAPDERVFTNITNIQWAGNTVVFPQVIPGDEWDRYFSIPLSGSASTAQPTRLTTTDGLIEGAASVALSKDGKTFYYCTNAGDIDRRHIWAVPTSGGTPQQITAGDGIETLPVPLASGRQLAVLSADARRPQSVGLWPATATPAATGQRAQKVIYPALGDFPLAAHVVPTNVMLKAEDGLEFHNQLFLPADIKPGEKRPALIFVHGGPARQMLLGYHYMSFYHVFYGTNQWLVSQGYIVLSVNYRSGIGYGRSFRQAPNTGARGNAEYADVLAAGKYLAGRADVDPNRVGIWGLSYGGLLTADALARNSDIFKAGVDLAGVHLEGSSLDPESVSYKSSAISEIDKWKSPVLLIHGDDDRNVNFGQTVGLVQLLRARKIYHELIVFPDDVHETLLHSRWLYTFDRIEAFLKKFLGDAPTPAGGQIR